MSKITGRVVSILLTFCLVMTSLAMVTSVPSFAASKASISKKKVTLKVGKTCTLTIKRAKHKVKWSTTNKKIVSIKKKSGKRHQKVVIKAGKKTGTCYIKARVGKKTLKCKVTVRKSKKKTTKPTSPVIPVKPDVPEEERVIEIRDLNTSSENLTEKLTAETPVAGDTDTETSFVNAYTDFAFGLMQESIGYERENNRKADVLISPESVVTALAMTEMGAAGQTLKEFEDTLGAGMPSDTYNAHLSSLNRRLMDTDAYIYNVSNSIWTRDNIKDAVRPEFLQANKNYHDADFYAAPFSEETVRDMNAWVYNKSRNMIDKIIDNLSKDSRMVLINTIAFEGKWREPFSSNAKVEKEFTSYNGTIRKVMMLRDTGSYQYFELNGGQGFVKGYRDSLKAKSTGSVAFVGILPPDGVDADSFIASLKGKDFLTAWNSKKYKQVRLMLPEFKCDFSNEMQDILPGMGIEAAFSPDADFDGIADFSLTPDTPGLRIDRVIHKTHIELDENGTKAAAATAVVMEKNTSVGPGESPIKLEFNRPFVYMLVDTQTGMPLFIGEKRTVE